MGGGRGKHSSSDKHQIMYNDENNTSKRKQTKTHNQWTLNGDNGNIDKKRQKIKSCCDEDFDQCWWCVHLQKPSLFGLSFSVVFFSWTGWGCSIIILMGFRMTNMSGIVQTQRVSLLSLLVLFLSVDCFALQLGSFRFWSDEKAVELCTLTEQFVWLWWNESQDYSNIGKVKTCKSLFFFFLHVLILWS